jgi:gentisate 1,2-dioxygenase
MDRATPALVQFSKGVGRLDVMPLWERAEGAVRPGTACVPKLWRYADLRPKLIEAALLIDEERAERRVLVLENPSLRGTTFITNSLYAGLQIIMPGETARLHRHTPNALRFLIEGEGGYTEIGGERAHMRPGDFIDTPNWSWHAHGNKGSGPVVWLDGLDTPFTRFFGATFRENSSGSENLPARHEGNALASFGTNLLPMDGEASGPASPLLIYPYERTREALEHAARHERPDPTHGFKMRYANPATGAHPFPTMAAFLQFLPHGFSGGSYRSTEGTVFAVVEGEGQVDLGGEKFAFAQHDVFVVPPWTPYRVIGAKETVLFSFSDRAAQDTLGFWREEAS